MIVIFLLTCFGSLYAQEQITIDLNNRSMSIHNLGEHIRIDKEDSYSTYEHLYWGNNIDRKDTFFYQKIRIVKEKNLTWIFPVLQGSTYKLHLQTIGKSWNEKDSIFNKGLQRMYYKNPSSYKSVSHNLTPVKYYNKKYPYADIYQTYKYKDGKRYRYVSEISRVLIVDEIKYVIHVKVRAFKYTKSIHSSRKAFWLQKLN